MLEVDPKSADLIRPLAIGDDVRRWHIRDKKRYLLFTRRGVEIEKYPAVLAHLQKFRERLEPRPKNWDESKPWPGRKPGTYKWYEIQDDIAYFREFDKAKIIYPSICTSGRFAYSNLGWFSNDKTFFIDSTDLYLLGFLNSEYCWKYLESVCSSIQGGALELRRIYMSQLPIPIVSKSFREDVEGLVKVCLEGDDDATKEAEMAIGLLFKNLYGF